PETAILSAGTPNAYRRRRPYTFCPTNNTWGYDNRTVGLRVIEGHDHAVRIEQRDGSADINPYYLLASQIAAGLRGVEEELDPGDPELGNGYENTEATALPSNIETAVAAARESEFVAELLGPDLLEIWLGQADREIEFLSQQVTPVETARYLRRF
ncbi:MAG: glutamine synthetase, partial [Acidimicrobiia bacterium]|nr:glutamine synthetase [Acidimicrobiia bacterium]